MDRNVRSLRAQLKLLRTSSSGQQQQQQVGVGRGEVLVQPQACCSGKLWKVQGQTLRPKLHQGVRILL
jgi:hypothetical protein